MAGAHHSRHLAVLPIQTSTRAHLMPHPEFDRSRLKLKPLSERVHDLQINHWLKATDAPVPFSHPDLAKLADRIRTARQRGAAVILMMGAHVLRAGVNAHIIDLMER